MRVAVWTPLPPEPSGIADYNAMLLTAMARDARVHLTAIVRDDARDLRAPVGVAVVAQRDYRPEDYDIDLYHVGNNPTFHGYMFQAALHRPGVTVLHDPAILDLVEVLLGDRRQRIFEVEVAYNLGCSERDEETLQHEIATWDRTRLLMSRRLIESSTTTLVHSRWAAQHLRSRFGDVNVRTVPFAVDLGDTDDVDRPDSPLVLGVFGNLSFHKRVPEVVAAFAAARERGLDARLVVAGRRDSPAAEHRIATLIDEFALHDVVDVAVDVDVTRFRSLQRDCDVVVGLRWPTAGETSASLLECFALAKAAIVSDIPQNREFSDEFCWRVSVDADAEHEQLVTAMLRAAEDLTATRRAGRAARDFVSRHFRVEDVAKIYVEELRRAIAAPATTTQPPHPGLGINAIASWAGATGLAEAGRRSALALLNEGVAIATTDVNLWAKVDEDRIPPEIAVLPHGHPYDIGVSFLNVNEFHVVEDWQLRGHGAPYLIAMWYWELPALPQEMIKEIARVDEIWVASEFVRDVFLRYTTKPIHVMPCVVEPVADPLVTRESLGLPDEDVVVFLVTFDANSTIARKNPYGALKAFEEAFGTGRRDVQLVVKVINLADYPVVRRDLRRHVERIGGLLIESDMAAGEIAALIQHSDVYVSMHRSEGFGLGLAEAMFFARPVIATGNSGNMDFMTALNSCLVGYRSMVVHRNELMDNPTAMVLYQPGNLWVDPDVHDAARLMRWLFDHPEERERLGRRAAADIRAGFSSAAAGRAMRARLDVVAQMLGNHWSPPADVTI
ncbi:MAG: glycosyltransferase [Acidobacteria bacterium]|nr:glycosyltransferase [Acidobacteriota bacterium]